MRHTELSSQDRGRSLLEICMRKSCLLDCKSQDTQDTREASKIWVLLKLTSLIESWAPLGKTSQSLSSGSGTHPMADRVCKAPFSSLMRLSILGFDSRMRLTFSSAGLTTTFLSSVAITFKVAVFLICQRASWMAEGLGGGSFAGA